MPIQPRLVTITPPVSVLMNCPDDHRDRSSLKMAPFPIADSPQLSSHMVTALYFASRSIWMYV